MWDRLGSFGALVTVVRWGTVAVGLALAALDAEPRTPVIGGLVLVVYAAVRSVWPLPQRSELGNMIGVIGEVLLTLAVVVATGYWSSPYVFSVTAALMVAGFARGFGFAIRTAIAAAAAVAIPLHLESETAAITTSFQWAGELVLIAVAAGYSRRLFGEAQERLLASEQANELLLQLHSVAQELPTSLDLEDAAGSLARGLREHVPEADTIAVLMVDAYSGRWTTAFADGVRLPTSLPADAVPGPVAAACSGRQPTTTTVACLSPTSAEGMYLPLAAGGRIIGVAALESDEPDTLPSAHRIVDQPSLQSAALALDNARWFSRLRTVGADEERQRIARDLHDRLGQSLAYLSFELDRIARAADGSAVHPDLVRLRSEARSLVTEVRDTLYDLRTDVSEERDLPSTILEFIERVSDRTDATITLDATAESRLPLRQEREMWRIAQEAVTNAIKHSGASQIRVTWRCEPDAAELRVTDDGTGMTPADSPPGSYGITGMHERASAIGAVLDIEAAAGHGQRDHREKGGQGTAVSCRLKRR